MIRLAAASLATAGYDILLLGGLVRVDLPAGYRGMTLEDGAAIGPAAFTSQDMLNHVLEEELLHLQQRPRGEAIEFAPGTARALEENIHEHRRVPCPSD